MRRSSFERRHMLQRAVRIDENPFGRFNALTSPLKPAQSIGEVMSHAVNGVATSKRFELAKRQFIFKVTPYRKFGVNVFDAVRVTDIVGTFADLVS